MAVILEYYLSKNGSTDWGTCQAGMSDQIRGEVLVQWTSSELGRVYHADFNIRKPDNTIITVKSPSLTAKSGVDTLISSVIPLSLVGNYSIAVVILNTG